ncbi:hypothetical protein LguiA_027269 [Lonicera macranthoides]
MICVGHGRVWRGGIESDPSVFNTVTITMCIAFFTSLCLSISFSKALRWCLLESSPWRSLLLRGCIHQFAKPQLITGIPDWRHQKSLFDTKEAVYVTQLDSSERKRKIVRICQELRADHVVQIALNKDNIGNSRRTHPYGYMLDTWTVKAILD